MIWKNILIRKYLNIRSTLKQKELANRASIFWNLLLRLLSSFQHWILLQAPCKLLFIEQGSLLLFDYIGYTTLKVINDIVTLYLSSISNVRPSDKDEDDYGDDDDGERWMRMMEEEVDEDDESKERLTQQF